MDIFDALNMIGGLSLFLYGMHVMGNGLSKMAGGKLEKILEKLTTNRIFAVLLGAGVTAVIQSSSATTVMVVGFVNSGIMKLSQAVGIIMGANIGTTITSWLLSLTGIEGSTIWLKLLKPSSFSPVLAAIGILFVMSGKGESKKKDLGSIMLGFAILMFGMETMSGSVSGLADNPSFVGIMTAFSHPVLGMAVGAILTAIIQSSSASVGILQALCATGAVHYSVALPIIMGQNIGTCVTSILSSIGASKNARRAAMVHLYFNLIGTSIFMVGFYALNTFLDFAFLGESANAMGIAMIHSLFNIGATIVLFPFSNFLVKLTEITIPDKTPLMRYPIGKQNANI
ncbi:MAG: Na/Pi cotransporter family protein [Lachnospiraceae bacterium]|nr:Na/Pi cotransporter family protein [Lachnospiraceae bacterium]